MSSPAMRFIYLSLIAVTLGVTASSSDAAPTVGHCQPTKTSFSASARDGTTTTVEGFVNIPETQIAFVQGVSTPSCVIVQFTTMLNVDSNSVFEVRAVLDQNTIGLPNLFQLAAFGNTLSQTHTANFIFPNVAPGTHRIRMQFGTTNGQLISVDRHNTIVNYTR